MELILVWYAIAFLALFLSCLGSVVVGGLYYYLSRSKRGVVLDLTWTVLFMGSLLLAGVSLFLTSNDIALRLGLGGTTASWLGIIGGFLGVALTIIIVGATYRSLKQIDAEHVATQPNPIVNES